MAFLVRKLNKRDTLCSLSEADNVEDILADLPTSEFRTTRGTLSTWLINSLDELNNAVLAIAVSSSNITKMDFIVIDTALLDNNGLEYKQTYAGREIPIPDLQDTHFDIIEISLKKLENCSKVYKTIFLQEDSEVEKFIVRFTESQIMDLLKDAIENNRVDDTKATGKIKEAIKKLQVA